MPAAPESDPIPTPGLEPSSMTSHSPPASPPQNPTWGAKDAAESKLHSADKGVNELPEKVEEMKRSGEEGEVKERTEGKRKRVVVVGLGMVGVAFM